MKSSRLDIAAFLAASFLLSAVVFGPGAMLGTRLLAPLDVGAAIFEAFRFVDPEGGGTPRSHYLVDLPQ